MSAKLRETSPSSDLVLSRRQPDLYVLHHSDCASLISDNLDDDRYVKVRSVEEAKRIAEKAEKPIISCSVCHK